MKILTVEGNDTETDKTAQKLQQKFGNNFNASLGLAQMLKTKSEQVAFDKLINPIVDKLAEQTTAMMFIS
jgi:hypothetical protein